MATSTREVLEKIQQIGLAGLYTGTEPAREIASLAVRTIIEAQTDTHVLNNFFLSKETAFHNVIYSVVDNGNGTGTILRTFKAKKLPHNQQKNHVCKGPLVPMHRAAAIVAALNS